jgi:hypothetical protein
MRPSQRKAALAAGAAGVLVIVLGGTTVALAQSPESVVNAAPSASGSAQPKDQSREQARQQHRDEMAAALAAELGVDKDKVAAALAKYEAEHKPTGRPDRGGGTRPDLTSRLDAAVTAGTITQAEADAIKKAAAAGVLGGPGGRPSR